MPTEPSAPSAPDQASDSGSTGAVLDAARCGDRDRLAVLLEADPSLAAARDENGVSLPLVALYHRQGEAAVLAAEHRRRSGPPLDLYEAAALGDEARIDEIVREAGEERIAEPGPDGFSALHLAAFFGQPRAAALLVGHGAPTGQPSSNRMAIPPLASAVAAGNVDTARLLLDTGVDPNAAQQGGITPLMSAASTGNDDLVELLLSVGADPTLESDDGRTAAGIALERGHGDLAARLETVATSDPAESIRPVDGSSS